MACALCLVNTQLRLSHIVPEFMYRQMYDVKHRFFAMTAMSSERVRLHQKGLREELLCDQCEQRFCRYEHTRPASLTETPPKASAGGGELFCNR